MTTPKLYPNNDLAFVVTLSLVGTDGRRAAATPTNAGTPTAFLTTSSDSDASAAHVSFVTTPSYTTRAGRWLVLFDAADLDVAELKAVFGAANTEAWCIIAFADNVRAAVQLEYRDANVVTLSEP